MAKLWDSREDGINWLNKTNELEALQKPKAIKKCGKCGFEEIRKGLQFDVIPLDKPMVAPPEDNTFYRILGQIVRGKVLKQVLLDYYKNPPSQAELNQEFAEWEQRIFSNRIKLGDYISGWIVEDMVIVKDSVTGKTLWQEDLPLNKVTNIYVEELKQRVREWQKKHQR